MKSPHYTLMLPSHALVAYRTLASATVALPRLPRRARCYTIAADMRAPAPIGDHQSIHLRSMVSSVPAQFRLLTRTTFLTTAGSSTTCSNCPEAGGGHCRLARGLTPNDLAAIRRWSLPGVRPKLPAVRASAAHSTADPGRRRPSVRSWPISARRERALFSFGQHSARSAISRASSTSIPRYRTVDSSLRCPSNSWTGRRFLVRR